MARKKQLVDVEVLSKIMAVKDLERTLRDNIISKDSEILRKLGSREFTDAEEEQFATGYIAFAEDYTSEVISGRLQAVYDEHREVLDGTPEGKYIQDLIESSERAMHRRNEVYDIEVKDLSLPTRLKNCLKNDEISYLGELVQRTDEEMLRIPNFGDSFLRKIQYRLNEHGLSLGMKIDYTSPEKRK